MTKQDFTSKYSPNSTIRKAMMVDLNMVITHALKEKKEHDFLNGDCE